MIRFRALACALLPSFMIGACGPAPTPTPPQTPPEPTPQPAPAPTPTAPPAAVTPKAPPPGTRTQLATRKDESETWDKMRVVGGRLWIVTEVNKWTTGPMYVPAARLYSVPVTGGELVKHLDLEGLATLATDDTSLFVAITKDLSTMSTPRAKSPTGRIFRLPLGGGAPVDVATEIEPKTLAVDDDRVWFDGSFVPKAGGKSAAPSAVKAPLALAVDATHLYFTQKGGRVLRVAKAGGATQTLAEKLPDEPAAIALDGTHVYVSAMSWTGESGNIRRKGVVARVPKEGGAVEVIAQDIESVRGVWVSGDDVFAIDGRAGRPGAVLRIAKSGGKVDRFAEDRTLGHIAVDDRALYLTSDGVFEPETKKRLKAPFVLGITR